jgi:indolepyruvate ferredoxin oxidoreductase alpha subunit
MMPAFAVKRRIATDKRKGVLVAWVEVTPLNRVEMRDPEIGITCAGALYNHVRETMINSQ